MDISFFMPSINAQNSREFTIEAPVVMESPFDDFPKPMSIETLLNKKTPSGHINPMKWGSSLTYIYF
jgi:hypothetical protein